MQLCGSAVRSDDDAEIPIPASMLKQLIKADPLSAPSTPLRCSRSTTPPPTTQQLGATPSPLMLNPMTEEDWTARQISSNLKLSFVDDHSRKLLTGVKLHLCREGGELKPVTLRFDRIKSMFSIHFDRSCDTVDEQKKVDHDDNDTILLPVSSIASIKESKTSFTTKLRPSVALGDNLKQLRFECSSAARKDGVVDGFKTLVDANRPLTLKRRNSRRSTIDRSLIRLSNLSRQSVVGLPITEEDAATNASDSSPQQRIRVHEAEPAQPLLPNHHSSTPAEQGMELTLVDPAAEMVLKMPILGSGSKEEHMAIPKDFPILPVGSLGGGDVTMNPWCATDVCSISDVTEAFREMFGVKKQQQQQHRDLVVDDSLIGDKSGYCFDAALFVAEDMALTEQSGQLMPIQQQPAAVPIAPKPSRDMSKPRDDTVRNRADNVNKQAKHWQGLKNTITFSAHARQSPFLQTARSMGDIEGLGEKQGGPKSPSKEFFLIQAVDDMFDQLIPDAAGTASPERNGGEDVLYYDSDPEDVRERTFRRGSRQAIAEHSNRSEQAVPIQTLQLPREIIHSKSLTDAHIKTIVDLMKNCKLNLLWHPNGTEEDPIPRPMCVKAWIERGTYLMNQNFVQPKFMWKAAHEADLKSQRKVNLLVEKVDLLEIFRIDSHVKTIDRTAYPMALQQCCFAVKTKTNYFLFQASTKKEKAHIVFGLKLMVARLASLLIVRDMAAVEEFFESVETTVPGKVPDWIRGTK